MYKFESCCLLGGGEGLSRSWPCSLVRSAWEGNGWVAQEANVSVESIEASSVPTLVLMVSLSFNGSTSTSKDKELRSSLFELCAMVECEESLSRTSG